MSPQFSARNFLLVSGGTFLSLATIVLLIGGVLLVQRIGNQGEPYGGNSITVSGTGEVFAVPNIAEVSFVVRSEANDVDVAQEQVTDKIASIIEWLTEIGIEEKDIQTSSYSSAPRYEWPGDGKRELVGYELSHSITVKVRDLENIGEVLSVLGNARVDSLNGPNFRIEDQDEYKADARELAIIEAQQKAQELADQLGVRLGKVVGFWEDEFGGYPEPYYAIEERALSFDSATASSAPSVPAGENRVQSRVNITYKIK